MKLSKVVGRTVQNKKSRKVERITESMSSSSESSDDYEVYKPILPVIKNPYFLYDLSQEHFCYFQGNQIKICKKSTLKQVKTIKMNDVANRMRFLSFTSIPVTDCFIAKMKGISD